MRYGQFCPIAKAAEILGERWTFLIVRELLGGARRFGELQRGLGDISPALLAARLRSFEQDGLIVRRSLSGQRGYEYLPTAACEELKPVIAALGEWGMSWARRNLTAEDFDVELLMLYLKRSVDPAELPGSEKIIQFKFTDLQERADWWLLVRAGAVEVCSTSPSRDADVFLTTTVRTMIDIWMGDRSHWDAVLVGALVVEGDPALTGRIGSWLRLSMFSGSKRSPLPETPDSGPPAEAARRLRGLVELES